MKVCEVSVFLARKLQAAGIKIDVELVARASLLHDIFKIAVLKDPNPNKFHPRAFTQEELAFREELRNKYPGKHESEIAYDILKEDHPRLALTILNEGNPHYTKKNQEESLIHYADMRVFRDDVVGLDKRFAYIKEKYCPEEELWNESLRSTLEMENNIFQHLNFKPEDLKREFEGA